jgi:predicted glutamine amidotransferase
VCRLFGMSGGSKRVRANFWLLDAPDSLRVQSTRMPDGTGLGIFGRLGHPLVHRRPRPAYEDRTFAREARIVSSTTFIAHVRYTSGSTISVENTHPFEQHGRLFGHNGVLRGLDELVAELGPDASLVHGETDSERFFTLVTREIERAGGDVERGLTTASEWAAEHLPIYALNVVLTTPHGLWALRYPETHGLYVLERPAGGHRVRRHFDGTSANGLLRVRSLDLLDRPAVVIASEPLDDSPEWRSFESGELIHVGPDLEVSSRVVLAGPPAHQLTHADLHPEEAASQHV